MTMFLMYIKYLNTWLLRGKNAMNDRFVMKSTNNVQGTNVSVDSWDRSNIICVIDRKLSDDFLEIYKDCIRVIEVLDNACDIDPDTQKGHGNAVCDALLSLGRNCKIIFFPVYHSTTVSGINTILRFILDNKLANVFNMSCGFSRTSSKSSHLEKTCNEMKKNGIHIVAARDELYGTVYPASFSTVIGVCVKDIPVLLDIENNMITIKKRLGLCVYWSLGKRVWMDQSSILSPVVAFCLFEALKTLPEERCLEVLSLQNLLYERLFNTLKNTLNIRRNNRV